MKLFRDEIRELLFDNFPKTIDDVRVLLEQEGKTEIQKKIIVEEIFTAVKNNPSMLSQKSMENQMFDYSTMEKGNLDEHSKDWTAEKHRDRILAVNARDDEIYQKETARVVKPFIHALSNIESMTSVKEQAEGLITYKNKEKIIIKEGKQTLFDKIWEKLFNYVIENTVDSNILKHGHFYTGIKKDNPSVPKITWTGTLADLIRFQERCTELKIFDIDTKNNKTLDTHFTTPNRPSIGSNLISQIRAKLKSGKIPSSFDDPIIESLLKP